MAEYRLTDRARADLIDIYDFTESKFGAYQADAYYVGLIRSCGLVADFPRIGQPVDELAPGLSKLPLSITSDLLHYSAGSRRNPCHRSRRPRHQTATFQIAAESVP
jgi:toxin ParE1/3/4